MDSTHNPETMTVEERRAEVARILARGLVRCAREARQRTSDPPQEVSDSRPTRLASVPDLSLTVAHRPGG